MYYNQIPFYPRPLLHHKPKYYPNYQRLYPNRTVPYQQPKTDYGKEPFTLNIAQASKNNNTYRTAIWTGEHLQVTLMSINIGDDIGLEIHPDTDQFLRIEQGQGLLQMGEDPNNPNDLTYQANVFEDSAIMVPAGTWHNIINTGPLPLKIYSIYAPPHHPYGTVQQTKADAMES
ncbi:cupin domain-containing protein [Alkalicoccobacillus porphyridii]|uniref:Cupin domain-containing protein n=1 Tax=Alkalicoccobacillus porphyridii TaxID=2597270 RepID=A0A553ZWY9_9BACI|nr:cupin domain-containing protein [Alkalicoccobacillus porphyridii]TSB45905.1 cupin domain-containing protein [Alkalicoccobacillus porphyridii]